MLSLVEGQSGFGGSLERLGDLRRRRRRDMIDELVERAEWLPPGDRWLIDSVYREGRCVAEVAAILNQPPRILRRRVRPCCGGCARGDSRSSPRSRGPGPR